MSPPAHAPAPAAGSGDGRQRLPHLVEPMLAKLGQAFDSDRHLYEVKWDGIRAVTYVERGKYRMLSRNGNDLTDRYPELAPVLGVGNGTVLDGEIVVLKDGLPNFQLVLRRDRGRRGGRGAEGDLQRTAPAVYMVFDLMYRNFEPTLEQPLLERRAPLQELVAACGSGHVALSEGFVGAGVSFFREVSERGIEGVVAKRVDSTYTPGRRSDAWTKIKRREHHNCVVLGYLPKGDDDFQSLVVATDRGDGLRYAGRVGTGFNAVRRRQMNERLRALHTDRPLLPPPGHPEPHPLFANAVWVRPEIFCVVSCAEITADGFMRAPVFERIEEQA